MDRCPEIGPGPEEVAVDDDVAVDPVDVRALERVAGAIAAQRLDVVGERAEHPELDREVSRADVDRRRGFDRHLDAVDARSAARAVEADRRGRERVAVARARERGDDDEQEDSYHGQSTGHGDRREARRIASAPTRGSGLRRGSAYGRIAWFASFVISPAVRARL
jgi:hypothetical protein